MFVEIWRDEDGAMVSGAKVRTEVINTDRIDVMTLIEGAHGVEEIDIRVNDRPYTVRDRTAVEQLLGLLSDGNHFTVAPLHEPRETLVQYETSNPWERSISTTSVGSIDDADSPTIDGSAAD